MRELDRALNDIAKMREQMANSSEFWGFGPKTLAFTGALALLVAATQPLWLKDPSAHPLSFVMEWFATAAVALIFIGTEATARSKQVHGSMALPLLQSAAERFCPAIAAGGLLTAAILQGAPQATWMLPGLWQIIFGLGAFATARMLPRPMFIVGVWYIVCGLTYIGLGDSKALTGWSMGIPFSVGQLIVAGILHWYPRDLANEE
jgi:hypothetical protein